MLSTKERVYSCGSNDFGELGLGHRENSFFLTEIEALSTLHIIDLACCLYSCAITDSGQVFVWGTCPFGEFLNPERLNIGYGAVILKVKLGVRTAIAMDVE